MRCNGNIFLLKTEGNRLAGPMEMIYNPMKDLSDFYDIPLTENKSTFILEDLNPFSILRENREHPEKTDLTAIEVRKGVTGSRI
jgi:hypothetical protein